MNGENITLEMKDNIAKIIMNRPEKSNTFNFQTWEEFNSIINEIEKSLPRAIIITGAGEKAFSAGFDVSLENPQMIEMQKALTDKKKETAKKLISYIRATIDHFASLPIPIIAAINGMAYGGGAELAVRCDIRIIEEHGIICFSETKLGLMPDWGGGVALTRLVGSAFSTELICSGKKVESEEALRIGLVNKICEKGKSEEAAMDIARAISKNGPRAIRSALSVIRNTMDMKLKEALDFESEQAVDLIMSGECVHGIMAFLSKKEPEFPEID